MSALVTIRDKRRHVSVVILLIDRQRLLAAGVLGPHIHDVLQRLVNQRGTILQIGRLDQNRRKPGGVQLNLLGRLCIRRHHLQKNIQALAHIVGRLKRKIVRDILARVLEGPLKDVAIKLRNLQNVILRGIRAVLDEAENEGDGHDWLYWQPGAAAPSISPGEPYKRVLSCSAHSFW